MIFPVINIGEKVKIARLTLLLVAIRSALGYSKFIPRGDGSQIRDYIFVEDVIDCDEPGFIMGRLDKRPVNFFTKLYYITYKGIRILPHDTK